MGASQSSNVAEATTEVANKVSETTTVNATQLNNQDQDMYLYQCIIKLSGNFDFHAVAAADFKNSQIAKVNSQTNFDNKVQQSVVQEAISKVGSMGVGYAQATNNTSMFCSVSNEIVRQVNESARQFNSNSQSFNCEQSTIIADNLNVNFSSSADFFNDQLLENTSINAVTNDISQSVSQKASATVQGLAGFLVGIALIIAALGYALAKPLSSGSTKMLITFVLILVLCGIGIWMYVIKAPPFFDDPLKVAVHSNIVPSGCDGVIDPKLENVHIDKAPLRYQFALSSSFSNAEGIPERVNLISLAIVASAGSSANNAGYTMLALKRIQDVLDKLNPVLSDLHGRTDDDKMKNILGTTIPNLLINPAGDGYDQMYQIPKQFWLSSGSGTEGDDQVGTFTPSTFVWNESVPCKVPPSEWDDRPDEQGCSWPHPTMTTDLPFGIANQNNTNIEHWISTVTDIDGSMGPAFVRFILLYIFNQSMSSKIDLNVYQEDLELVYFKDPETNEWNIDFGKNAPEDAVHKFNPNSSPDFSNGNDNGGTVTLLLGICNNREYQTKQWFHQIGQWILFGMIGVMVLVVFIRTQTVKQKRK